jgi:lysozyme
MSQITGRRIKLGQMTITSRLSHSLRLVKAFEAFHGRALPQGDSGFVIGYGHTASARAGAVVTRAEADDLLIYDLGEVGRLLDIWVYAPMHDNQRQALIAFGFNVGVENLHKSTAMRRLNAGDYMGCAREIERWRMAELAGRGQVVDALVRRRAAEKALFLTPPDGFLKTAGAHLQPRFDGDRSAPAPLPAEPPVEPSAAMTAAQNVTARLRALLPDPEAPERAPEREDQASDTAEPAPRRLELPELDPPPHDREPIEASLADPVASSVQESVPSQDIFAEPSSLEPSPPEPLLLEPVADQAISIAEPGSDVEAERPAWPLDELAPPPPPFIASARRRAPTLVSANDFGPESFAPYSFGDDEPASLAPRPVEPPTRALAGAPAGAKESGAAASGLTLAMRERLTPLLAIVLQRSHFVFALFGILLFVVSVLLILAGKPSAANLAIGLVGVLCMTPTAYVLLGAHER